MDNDVRADKADQSSDQAPEIGLPVFALICSSIPAVLCLLALGNAGFLLLALIFWPVTFLVPLAGILMGIASLCRGRRRLGSTGVNLSVLAIVLPVVSVLAILKLERAGAYTCGM